jgi:hypothetical protein
LISKAEHGQSKHGSAVFLLYTTEFTKYKKSNILCLKSSNVLSQQNHHYSRAKLQVSNKYLEQQLQSIPVPVQALLNIKIVPKSTSLEKRDTKLAINEKSIINK